MEGIHFVLNKKSIFLILKVLSNKKLNQKQIISKTNLAERTVRDIISILEKEGFVKIDFSLDDMRKKHYYLTDKGEFFC